MGIRVAIIGGGGVRTPLLVEELLRRSGQLPVDEVRLMDTDARRLQLIGDVIREQVAGHPGPRLVWTTEPAEAISGADFVITMVRVGGERARVIDEQVALRHGVIGQETVGPGGFAMAMRSIPVLMEYARLVQRLAPGAWLVNLTNPAGVITQALVEVLGDRAIGVCDSPAALFEELRAVLAPLSAEENLRFDYVGLNHLGWVTGAWSGGRPLLPRLLGRADEIRHHGLALFDPELIRALGVIPTEYLYFYYYPERALRRIQAAGRTRGQDVLQLNEQLYRRLEQLGRPGEGAPQPGGRALAAYREYIRSREASYFHVEVGALEAASPGHSSDGASRSGGYEKVAVDIMAAMVNDSRAELTLLVRNRSAVAALQPDDVVEVPCIVDASGARPLASGDPPDSVRGLMLAVKAHERLTLEAARQRTYRASLRALLAHPLVADADKARAILDGYLDAYPHFLNGPPAAGAPAHPQPA